MIQSILHKGLRRLYEEGNARGITKKHQVRLSDILVRLDAAANASDLNLPNFRLHPLSGQEEGLLSVAVDENWWIFRFEGGHAFDVDYLDYH